MPDDSPDEPYIEPDFLAMDIRTYISTLPDPQQSICRSVILEGEKIADVRKIYGLTRWKIIEIIREALEPVAREYRIGSFRRNDRKMTGEGRGEVSDGLRESGGEGSRGVLPGGESRIDYRGSSRKITHTFFPRPRNPNPNPCQPNPPACTGGA